jgi:hypothetical protein
MENTKPTKIDVLKKILYNKLKKRFIIVGVEELVSLRNNTNFIIISHMDNDDTRIKNYLKYYPKFNSMVIYVR